MPSWLALLLLLCVVFVPVLGAITIRILGDRLTEVQAVGSTAVVVLFTIVSVLVLAYSRVDRLGIGNLTLLLPVVQEPVAQLPANVENPLPAETFVVTRTATVTPRATRTTVVTPTRTLTATLTPTSTEIVTITPTMTQVVTPTQVITPTPTITRTDTITPTATQVVTITPTITRTASITSTAPPVITPTPTITRTARASPTPTLAATATLTPTLAVTDTPVPPSPTPEPPPPRTYVVQPGDTLRSIAADFDVSVDDLLNANNLTREEGDDLRPGQELIIP